MEIFVASDNDNRFCIIHKQMINVETPPAAYSDDLNGEEIGNHKQMVNVETPPAAYSDELNGGEIGNLALLQLFELI